MAYSYADCLQNSYRVNWKIADVLGTMRFDVSRRWLPAALSGADAIRSLSETERRKLTHVEMGAYAHLFGYVEEFIAPKVVALAGEVIHDDHEAFGALTNFAAEEVKHMTLFREVRARVDETLGFPLALVPDARVVAQAVLEKHTGAVLLLTTAIEWVSQLHYLTAFKDAEGLDPLARQIFRSHWAEESQHARIDHLETLRAFASMSAHEKDVAVDDLIALVAAVDGLLQRQAALDVDNFQRHVARPLAEGTREEILESVLRAKRSAFIESAVTHPNFHALFTAVTSPEQQAKVQSALEGLLAIAA